MFVRSLAVLGLLACASQFNAHAADIPTEDDVLVLTDDNFDQALKENDVLLVEFYAPWCGHCKKLTPEYAKAAATLGKRDPPLRIAKVDATVDKKQAEVQKIRGFPTIKLFKGGAVSEYQGDRSAEAIVDFVVKKSGPPVTTVNSQKEADAFLEANPKAGIAFFSSLDSEGAKKFVEYANKFDAYPFAYTSASDVRSKLKADSKKDTLVFKTPEGTFSQALDLSGADAEEQLSTWVFGHAVELLFKYDQNKARELFGGAIKVHLLSFLDESAKNFDKISAAVKSAASKTRTKALTILVPKSEERILQAFDLTAADVPKLIIADLQNGPMKKFPFEGDVTKSSEIEGFLSDYFSGKLKPKLKTEERADSDWTGPVKIVKGSTFKEKVIESDDDVLLEFYAPWCGHCRQLEPKWEELGKKLEGAKNVVVAKMDSTANEVDAPGVNVMGYPTILFFKAGSKEAPIAYDQAREVDSFVGFLKKHASHPDSIPEPSTPLVDEEEDDDEEDDEEGDEEDDAEGDEDERDEL